jgi:hypothetical protein
MSALTTAFTCGLAFRFRELVPVFTEHLTDNGGRVLPHLLIADYAKFVTADDGISKWKAELLACLEEAFVRDSGEVGELISVSFIENLPFAKGKHHWSIDHLGLRMREQYSVIFRV